MSNGRSNECKFLPDDSFSHLMPVVEMMASKRVYAAPMSFLLVSNLIFIVCLSASFANLLDLSYFRLDCLSLSFIIAHEEAREGLMRMNAHKATKHELKPNHFEKCMEEIADIGKHSSER
eukprot:1521586-Amphidinium_carterae.1